MENDVLKNKIAPWQEKGRWYHGKITIPTTKFDDDSDELLKTDFYLGYDTGSYFILPKSGASKKIIDAKLIYSNYTISSTYIQSHNKIFLTDGRYGIYAYGGMTSGLVEVWIFIK